MKGSIKDLLQRLRKCRKSGNVNQQVDCLQDLASEYRKEGNSEEAIQADSQAIELCESNELLFDLCYSYRNLAEIYAEESKRVDAIKFAELYRNTATKCGNAGQIQLSTHVSGWIYEKLYNGSKSASDISDLETALSYCVRSLNYLNNNASKIDVDEQAVMSGGTSAVRKAALNRICAGIAGNLGEREKAEKFWRAAQAYAERKSDDDLKYDLQFLRLDFKWENPVKIARCLINMAPTKQKGLSYLELGKAHMYAGDLNSARVILNECLAKFTNLMHRADREELKDYCISMYKIFHPTSDGTVQHHLQAFLHKERADLLCYLNSDRQSPDLYMKAVEEYQLMYNLSADDRSRRDALRSRAITLSYAQRYAEAIDIFESVVRVERRMKIPEADLRQTRVLQFGARCSLLGQPHIVEAEFDKLKSEFAGDAISLQGINESITHFLKKSGADKSRHAIKIEQSDGVSEKGTDERTEKRKSIYGTQFWPDDKTILNACLEDGKRRLSDEELREHKDKKINHLGETKLHQAARSEDTVMVQRLIDMGYNVNARDNGGWTPLSEAVSYGRLENVRLLLKSRAVVDCFSKEYLEDEGNVTGTRITPLMEGCEKGYLSIAKELIKHGAAVDRRTERRWTAVHFLREWIKAEREANDGEPFEKEEEASSLLAAMEKKQANIGYDLLAPEDRLVPISPERPTTSGRSSRATLSPNRRNLFSYKSTMDRLGSRTKHVYDVDEIVDEVDFTERPRYGNASNASSPAEQNSRLSGSLSSTPAPKRRTMTPDSSAHEKIRRTSLTSEPGNSENARCIDQRPRSCECSERPQSRCYKSPERNTPVRVEHSPRLAVTIEFKKDDESLKSVMIPFNRDDCIATVLKRCTQKTAHTAYKDCKLSLRLDNGTELDKELPLSLIFPASESMPKIVCVMMTRSNDRFPDD